MVSVTSAAAAACSLAGSVAVPAEDRTVAARFEWNRGGLAAAGADDRSSVGCLSAESAATAAAVVLLCRSARLTALRSREASFLEKCLIRSGEGKFLPTVAARKLNVACHKAPRIVYRPLYHSFCRFFVSFVSK
jgi:hypothetical protein